MGRQVKWDWRWRLHITFFCVYVHFYALFGPPLAEFALNGSRNFS
jgi:hypothetical protein